MPAAKLRASRILAEFHKAEVELVGKAVVLMKKLGQSNTFGWMTCTDCEFLCEGKWRVND